MLHGETFSVGGTPVALVDAAGFDGEYVAHVKVTSGAVRLGDSGVTTTDGYLVSDSDASLEVRVQGESLYAVSGGATVDVLAYSA